MFSHGRIGHPLVQEKAGGPILPPYLLQYTWCARLWLELPFFSSPYVGRLKGQLAPLPLPPLSRRTK